MKKLERIVLVVCGTPLLLVFSLFASGKERAAAPAAMHMETRHKEFTLKDDMAFISVWGHRPDARQLQGFQRAVLYNARGEVVQRLDLGRDSIYSLDRMIHDHRTKGPLFIRMYRR